jgi:hypothetical protein
MNSYKIIDDFLSDDEFFRLQKLFLSPSVPWYYNKSVLVVGAKEKHFQFTHTIYNNWKPDSALFNDLMPILEVIAPKSLIRIKANLGTRTVENEETGFHCDTTYPCTTAILYLNTTNGYTVFEDGTKIEGIANRFVEFDSQLKHSGATQTDSQVRVVLNFNYIKDGGS